MILPGISGSFILVLLGNYHAILTAVNERNFVILVAVGFGAVFGLLTFSKLLKWLFEHFKNQTLTVLVGFIAGSLPKVWPWKNELDEFSLYLPQFGLASDQLVYGISFAFLGLGLVVLLEHIGYLVKKYAQ